MRVTKFRCVVCGKLTVGRMPRAGRFVGDTSFRFPRKHRDEQGMVCDGVYDEAEWIDVEAKAAGVPVWEPKP